MTSVTAQSHVWMMVVMVSGLESSFLFALSQCFLNFFWSRSICGSYSVSTYHLEQNGCKNFCCHFQSQQGKYTKIQEFIYRIRSTKNYSCEYNFSL